MTNQCHDNVNDNDSGEKCKHVKLYKRYINAGHEFLQMNKE